MKKNPLVEKFGKEARWVNYRMEERGGRTTKVPYSIDGRMASSTEPADWSTYAAARKASDRVGIVFTPGMALLGVDIDKCLTGNKITHEQKEIIADLILEADTYTEVSPSGEGLHIMLALSSPLALSSNRKAPFEAYTSGRYFTYTGNHYGEPREVRTVDPAEALRLLAVIGYPWKKGNGADVLGEQAVQSDPGQPGPVGLSDSEVFEKIASSKSAEKVAALIAGDLSAHGGDASSADMALLSHLAFWTGRDAAQMERLWLASALGSRGKTQERRDYRDRSIAAAISTCKAAYEPHAPAEAPGFGDGIEFVYSLTARGDKRFIANTENFCRVLRHHPRFRGCFRYDIFRNAYEIFADGRWRGFEDNDAVTVQTSVSVVYSDLFGKAGKDMAYDAMVKVAKECAIDSAADFVNSLVWDGEARLDSWLSKTYGCPEDEYHRAVASNWMKGLVKRILNPGCKFDYVLVLEGEQGSRKSTSLAVLGGNWHVETAMSTESKDFFMQFQGKAIVEFSEGETLSRTEVKRMKAIITMQSDKYRPPYERSSQDFPRRCVFAMTTNQTEYLKDETGNRRWLPVALALPEANIDWLKANRGQLFAEAAHRVAVLGESVHEFPREATLAAQHSRRVEDPNMEAVVSWYFDKVSDDDRTLNGITVDRAYKEALHGGFMSKPITKFEQMAIASIFRDTLKLVRKELSRNGIRTSRWFAPEGAQKLDFEAETEYEAAVRNF